MSCGVAPTWPRAAALGIREAKHMSMRMAMALWIGAALIAAGPSAGPSLAQQPAQAPAAPAASPAPDYGLPISTDQAKAVAAAAIDEARKNNWRMAVAVVGPDGSIVYFEKM